MAKRILQAFKWLGGGLLLLVIMAGILVWAILQSQPGHDFVLRTVLNQAPGYLDGDVRIQSLRSDGLLGGFTLHGVEILDDGDRPFVQADSVRVEYSMHNILAGRIVLSPADLWGARVVIETLHGDDESNVARIFAPLASDPDVVDPDAADDAPGFSVLLGAVSLHDSEFLLRLPLEGDDPPAQGVVETIPGTEGLYQRIHFTAINGHLSEVDILSPGREGERVTIDELAFTGQIFQEPFHIENLVGEVARAGAQLMLEARELRLPESELEGRVGVDWGDPDGGLTLDVGLVAPTLQLADLQWLESRIPRGEGRMELSIQGPLASSTWRLREMDLQVEDSRLQGQVGFLLSDVFSFQDTQVQVTSLDLALLEPWLEEPLPVEGILTGSAAVSGPFSALRVDGEVTFQDPVREIPESTVAVNGVLGVEGGLSAQGLSLRADPLRYGTLRAFAPELELVGEGTAQMELSGDLVSGLTLTADLTHTPSGEGLASRILASGTARQDGDDWILDLDGNLDPLSLDGLALALGQELPVEGEISGPLQVEGGLRALSAGASLSTAAGRLEVNGVFDVLDVGSDYRLSGQVQEFRLHQVVTGLPDPTVLSGYFQVDGSGLTLETLEGSAELELTQVDLGRVAVDNLTAHMEAREGRLLIEHLALRSPLGTLDGWGELGLREGSSDGEVQVAWALESVEALRPILLGDTVIAGDTLTALERLDLQMQGIDPDTLPAAMAVAMAGDASGSLSLRGTVQDLVGEGVVEVRDLLYGELSLQEGRVQFGGAFQGTDAWSIEGRMGLQELVFDEFELELVDVTGAYAGGEGEGEARAEIRRDETEAYTLGGVFQVDSLGVEATLDDLTLDLDQVVWSLAAPAHLRVEERTLQVDDLQLTRPAGEGDRAGLSTVRMGIRGTLSLDSDSDFHVSAQGADVHRLASVLQVLDPPQGFLDLDLDIQGPPDAPVMDGRFVLHEFEVDGTRLSRVEGTLDYRDQLARTELFADLDDRRLLTLSGRVPVDLSFREVENRFPDRSIQVTAQVDSFPAASALAFLDVLEDVDGILDGQVELQGTPDELRPSGNLTLRGGAFSLPELGLRLTDIGGAVEIRQDRTVEVDAELRARGPARIAGTIGLQDPLDPTFDLRITASNFQAVDRRDLNARVGGEVTLTGRYQSPRVGGDLRVEQGTIFVEEFARTAEVVDLSDPAFFDVVDTTLVAARPALEAAQNPFVQNLRVDVDLAIQRDVWLRSREMNVEIGGDLIVTFDRPRREILLVGTLQAIRGSYSAFGRQFQVQEGVVDFVGTPGIDPALDIQAVHRLRREGGEPLDILANVGGTLTNLRVDLTSEAQPPIAQSDLISYLIFGRPSYALASGESSILEGAAGAGVSVGVGAIATQLGQVVAQQFGVDYFTITQTREAGGLESAAGLSGTFADTQIEVGQYVADNLFLALSLRPLTGLGARTRTQFPGARLEWRFSDLWTTEGFIEDRFAREAASGFGELGLRMDKVLGFSLYREWGY